MNFFHNSLVYAVVVAGQPHNPYALPQAGSLHIPHLATTLSKTITRFIDIEVRVLPDCRLLAYRSKSSSC